MPVYAPDLDIASNTAWNFHLIAVVSEEKSQYTPTSNASLCIGQFPHLLLEVYSGHTESDCIRMLLQAGCLAQLGHALSQSSTVFIISAIYITNDFKAEWYFVYKPQAEETTVGLILHTAAHHSRLNRLNMCWRNLIF